VASATPPADSQSVITSPLAPPTLWPTQPSLPAPPSNLPIALLGPAAAGPDHGVAPIIAPADADGTLLPASAATAAGTVLAVSSHPGASTARPQPRKPATVDRADGPGRGWGLPCGGGAAGAAASAACGGGPGSSHGFFLALLLTLGGLAVLLSERLRLAPARWRPAAFIALLERPG
jgi:hypothetical protein